MSASLGRLTCRESFRESFPSFQFSCTQLADMGAMSNEGAAAPARIGTGDTSQRDASLLLSIPACELHQVRPSARFLKVLSAAERCWPRPPIPPSDQFLSSLLAGALSKQVSGGHQRLLERGELTLSVLDSTVAPVVGTHALQNAASPAAPATPAQPPGKQGPYPEVYQPPESGGGRGSASSRGGSDSEGEAAGGKSRGASRIVAAVGGTAWELLPASQTLKVRCLASSMGGSPHNHLVQAYYESIG